MAIDEFGCIDLATVGTDGRLSVPTYVSYSLSLGADCRHLVPMSMSIVGTVSTKTEGRCRKCTRYRHNSSFWPRASRAILILKHNEHQPDARTVAIVGTDCRRLVLMSMLIVGTAPTRTDGRFHDHDF